MGPGALLATAIVLAVAIWLVGRKSTACGVTLGVLAVAVLVIVIVVTATWTVRGTLTIR